jgi:hypothetical protein
VKSKIRPQPKKLSPGTQGILQSVKLSLTFHRKTGNKLFGGGGGFCTVRGRPPIRERAALFCFQRFVGVEDPGPKAALLLKGCTGVLIWQSRIFFNPTCCGVGKLFPPLRE